jgi:hypothetical protein
MGLVDQMREVDMAEVPNLCEEELIQWCKENQRRQDGAFDSILDRQKI